MSVRGSKTLGRDMGMYIIAQEIRVLSSGQAWVFRDRKDIRYGRDRAAEWEWVEDRYRCSGAAAGRGGGAGGMGGRGR